MTKFFITAFALFCVVAVAFAQDATEAASTDASESTEAASTEAASTEAASTEAPSTEAPSTEAPKPTSTTGPDVTTAQADDKYTAACKTQFPDKENVTAVQITIGPFASCTYQCAIVTQKIKRGIFELEVLELVGKPSNKDDHTSCAPSMECLKGVCNPGEEVDACLAVNADVETIQDSKNKCKKSCLGKDKKEIAEIDGNEGLFCWATKKIWRWDQTFPGSCNSGKCVPMI